MDEAERTAIGLYAMNAALIVVLFWHLHARLQDREDELRKLKDKGGERGEESTVVPMTPHGR